MACNLKMPVRRAKSIEIWDSGVAVISIWGTFDLLVCKVTVNAPFGVIQCSCLKIAINIKIAGL